VSGKPITRYEQHYEDMDERDTGEWVRYDDHIAAMKAHAAAVVAERDVLIGELTDRVESYETAHAAVTAECDAALAPLASLQVDYDFSAGEVQRVCGELEAEGQLRLKAEAEVARLTRGLRAARNHVRYILARDGKVPEYTRKTLEDAERDIDAALTPAPGAAAEPARTAERPA